ncbi:MAG: hypothetical protein FWE45_04625 [Firmicutes bacterium]|nr:hypothetical protein [Bacillota bacterium]
MHHETDEIMTVFGLSILYLCFFAGLGVLIAFFPLVAGIVIGAFLFLCLIIGIVVSMKDKLEFESYSYTLWEACVIYFVVMILPTGLGSGATFLFKHDLLVGGIVTSAIVGILLATGITIVIKAIRKSKFLTENSLPILKLRRLNRETQFLQVKSYYKVRVVFSSKQDYEKKYGDKRVYKFINEFAKNNTEQMEKTIKDTRSNLELYEKYIQEYDKLYNTLYNKDSDLIPSKLKNDEYFLFIKQKKRRPVFDITVEFEINYGNPFKLDRKKFKLADIETQLAVIQDELSAKQKEKEKPTRQKQPRVNNIIKNETIDTKINQKENETDMFRKKGDTHIIFNIGQVNGSVAGGDIGVQYFNQILNKDFIQTRKINIDDVTQFIELLKSEIKNETPEKKEQITTKLAELEQETKKQKPDKSIIKGMLAGMKNLVCSVGVTVAAEFAKRFLMP